MQARRAIALVLACVLGVCLVTTPGVAHADRHRAHVAALFTAATPDSPHNFKQLTVDAVSTPDGWTAALRPGTGTSDTSRPASPRTADAARIRGPPDEGLF